MAEDETNENEETENAEGEEGEDGEKVGGKKKLLLIVIILLLLVGGGAGAFLAGVFDSDPEAVDADEIEEYNEEDAVSSSAEGEITYYELPPFLVNINSGTQRTSFLKMKVTLELKGGDEEVAAVENAKPRIMDAFNTYLRELRTSDLSGSAGIYRLRQELLTRVNKTLHPVEVQDILFSEIVVQ